jgi:hypothetical protein
MGNGNLVFAGNRVKIIRVRYFHRKSGGSLQRAADRTDGLSKGYQALSEKIFSTEVHVFSISSQLSKPVMQEYHGFQAIQTACTVNNRASFVELAVYISGPNKIDESQILTAYDFAHVPEYLCIDTQTEQWFTTCSV